MKKILIVLDGAADLAIDVLDGKTPLESAEIPNLNYFAKNGKLGFMYPISENVIPGSDNALVSIFGNSPRITRRGVFEAVGAGINLKRGDLALRANFGTIENLKSKKVIDRRAGRTLTTKEALTLSSDLNKKIKLPCKFEFKPTVQHRGVLVLRGGFSENISNIDSEWMNSNDKLISGERKGEKVLRFSQPLDSDENSKYTSNILNQFTEQAFNILNSHQINLERKKKGLYPANIIFLRGAGTEIPELKKYPTWMSINSMPLEIGIAKISGMKNFSFHYPELKDFDVYENLYEGLNKSIKFAIKTIKSRHKDFSGCYIQFKETDVPGHDNKPFEKKKMIEIIDMEFFGFLKKFVQGKKIKVVVTCDHSTPCRLKSHSSDFVPVLVYDGKSKDEMTKFNERQALAGSLGKIYGREFMEKAGLR